MSGMFGHVWHVRTCLACSDMFGMFGHVWHVRTCLACSDTFFEFSERSGGGGPLALRSEDSASRLNGLSVSPATRVEVYGLVPAPGPEKQQQNNIPRQHD